MYLHKPIVLLIWHVQCWDANKYLQESPWWCTCWWVFIHGEIHGNGRNLNGWKWGCNCITWAFGVEWKQQYGLCEFYFCFFVFLFYFSFFKSLLSSSLMVVFVKVDVIDLLFLVVIGLWSDVWNKIVILGPKP